MKTILHLFRTEKFTNDFICFINENSNYKHTFWVYGESDCDYSQEYLKYENVKVFPRIDIKLNKSGTFKQLQMYDLIFYHGIFDNCIIDYFYTHRLLLKKLMLYFWGGDIPVLGDWKERLKKKYVVKNATSVGTIIPKDYESLQKLYAPKGSHFNIQYYSDEIVEFINKRIEKERSFTESINIQIGNSATATNDHIYILDLLKKFKEENINIYVPLSYGDVSYAESVIEYGKAIFGDKFIPLQKFMSLENYNIFLESMDVAIFNMCRQQAMGNIFTLLGTGCKIYLHPNGKIIEYLRKSSFIVMDTNEISNMSIGEFFLFSEEQKQHNKKLVCEKFDKEKYVKGWEDLFEGLLDKIEGGDEKS